MGSYHGEIKVIPNPIPNGTFTSTLEGPGSISCGQYMDWALGKFPPICGLHLFYVLLIQNVVLIPNAINTVYRAMPIKEN